MPSRCVVKSMNTTCTCDQCKLARTYLVALKKAGAKDLAEALERTVHSGEAPPSLQEGSVPGTYGDVMIEIEPVSAGGLIHPTTVVLLCGAPIWQSRPLGGVWASKEQSIKAIESRAYDARMALECAFTDAG